MNACVCVCVHKTQGERLMGLKHGYNSMHFFAVIKFIK